MGSPQPPGPVKLLIGLLASSDALLQEATATLHRVFGEIDTRSNITDWHYSAYYASEMGSRIKRQFITFEPLIDPGELAAIKQRTNTLEGQWRTDRGRQVNLDPGYLAAGKLVLASTKDAAHRIYLQAGIYAEVTLRFCSGSFQAYPHSYPDYATPDAIAFFNRARTIYLAQLRAGASSRAFS